MSKIPENTVSQKDLHTWSQLQADLASVKAAEMLLRTKIFKALFPNPVEGTNSVPLGTEGWVVKAQYKIDRTPDVALLTAKAAELREKGVPVDSLIRTKPELAKTEYNKLTDEQRHEFDQVLTIKPGAPAIEIVLPKRAQAAA